MIDELIVAENKYISSKRAAGLTGYTTDYLGQLCRAGKIDGRLVGRNWYINEIAIIDNKKNFKKQQTVDNKQYEDNTNDLIYYRHDESPLNPELDSDNNKKDILENIIPLKIDRHEKRQIKTHDNIPSVNRHAMVRKHKSKIQQPTIKHHVSKAPIISVAGVVTMAVLIVIGSTMFEQVVQYVSKGDKIDVSTRIQLANVNDNIKEIGKLYQKFRNF